MSYILNALRKSEQERQAIQPDSITHRISVQHPKRSKTSTFLIAILLISNLAILVYFLGFTAKNQPTAVTSLTDESGLPADAATRHKKTTPITPTSKPAENKTVTNNKIVTAKPAAVATPVIEQAAEKPTVNIETVRIEPPQPQLQKIEPVVSQEPVKTAPPIVRNDLPFMDDLPAELRRSLPNLSINVFGYAATPAQRFVMIDLVKYVPGQRIKDILELKEIREDCIVVSYEETTFKIKRP
ncbi:general secretion pathway protein GspB [Methylomonas sp. AM2-LC]|uniref:general secretion pathway protein GspB n=1 Tax=Methylomonas sp. AM2-LC TaxID=3153301 RepID=UPI0032679E59